MKLVFIARGARRQISGHGWVTFAAAAGFCLLTLVAGATVLGTRTVLRWGTFLGQNVHVLAYLGEDIDREHALGLADILRRVPGVAHVNMVEPAQALADLRASMAKFKSNTSALEGLEAGYFPRSLEVRLSPASDLSLQAADLAKHLRGVPGVVDVDAMGEGLAHLSAWVTFGKRLGLAIASAAILLASAGLVGVFLSTRRVTRERAAVLVQLGETPVVVRLPSGLAMVLPALTGGSLGMLLLLLGWRPLLGSLERLLGLVTGNPLPLLRPAEIALSFGLLLVVGFATGFLAVPLPQAANEA